MLHCNKNLHKRNVFFHRGVVIPHSQTATEYNSTLEPKIEAYLPVVQVEVGVNNKAFPLDHQGTVDPPNISIPEGG